MNKSRRGDAENLRETLLNLERARAKEKLQRQESQTILASLRILSRRGDPEEIFQSLAHLFQDLLGFEDIVLLRNCADERWRPVQFTQSALRKLVLTGGPIFDRVQRGETVAVFEAAATDDWKGLAEHPQLQVRSVLHFGLEVDGDSLIVACIHSQPGMFGPEQAQIIQRFRPLLNQAMASASAYQDRERVEALTSQRREDLEKIAMLEQGTQVLGVGLMQWDGRQAPTRPSQTLMTMVRPWQNFANWWQALQEQISPEQLREVLRSGDAVEAQLQDADGNHHSFEIACSNPAQECGGGLHPLLVSDRTADHNLVRDRQRAEHRYEALFHESRDGILILSMSGTILELNQQAREMIGREDEQIGSWLQFIDGDDHPRCQELLESIADQDVHGIELQFVSSGGQAFLAELTANAIELDGRPCVQALVRNITERKEAERALRSSEQRKGAILETALDCIVSVDHQGHINEFNPAAENTFGWKREEILGKTLEETLIPAVLRDAHSAGFARYMQSGESRILGQRLELPAMCRDGSEILTEITITETRDESGRSTFIAFVRDITQWKADQEALQQAKEEAEAANQSKSQFLASMSHELRTPIHVIAGLTKLATEHDLEDDVRNMLEVVDSSSQSLLALIDDLLDISKIEVGEVRLENDQVSLFQFFDTLKNMFAKQALDQGLDLVFEMGDNLPVALEFDPNRLRQILINLLNNALKFTRQGRITVKVDFFDQPQPKLEIHVADTGQGIPPQQLGQIFERFTQLDRAGIGSHARGAGLGLAISREISELMGGELRAESAVGKGSTFILSLPLQRIVPRAEIQNDGEDLGLRASKAGMRILVVDDNPGNSLLAERLLSRLGHTALVANSGAEGLEILRRESVDLVLLDIEMPEMDGFQTLQHIRNDIDAELPVIALTAHAIPGFSEKCLNAGMTDYLAKPYTKEDLVQLLDRQSDGADGPMVWIDDDVADLVPGYLANCEQQVAEAAQLLGNGDLIPAGRIAHKLKGTGSSYGFSEISRLGSELNQACDASDQVGAQRAAQELDAFLKSVSYRVKRA